MKSNWKDGRNPFVYSTVIVFQSSYMAGFFSCPVLKPLILDAMQVKQQCHTVKKTTTKKNCDHTPKKMTSGQNTAEQSI